MWKATCLEVLGESTSSGLRAMCQHSRGEVARSMERLDSFKSALGSASEPSNRQEMLSYRDIAMFYAWIGEVDETLDWLDRAFLWSHNAVEFRLIDSAIFDEVREDSSFRSGLERIRTRMRERLLEALAG